MENDKEFLVNVKKASKDIINVLDKYEPAVGAGAMITLLVSNMKENGREFQELTDMASMAWRLTNLRSTGDE